MLCNKSIGLAKTFDDIATKPKFLRFVLYCIKPHQVRIHLAGCILLEYEVGIEIVPPLYWTVE